MSEFLRCRDCKHDKGKCVGSSRRGGHKNCFEPREMTNADRIRAMSDEELAETLYGLQKEVCRFMAIRLKYPVEKLIFEENLPELIDWLQQPAEEILHG